MKQATLAAAADQGAEFERFRRPTRRDLFLQTMDTIVPWAELCEVIEPHYPKAGLFSSRSIRSWSCATRALA